MRWMTQPGRRLAVVSVVVVAFLARSVTPAVAGPSAVKLQNWSGAIDLSGDGPAPFTLSGTASHLGQFSAEGEVTFHPSGTDGSMLGEGVVVFEAANGDLLAGVVEWTVPAGVGDFRSSSVHFSWRDAVTFSDGTIAESTGRFVDTRPPGLVVIAIIAILIGMLLPAVQKVREPAQ